jgi:hypothetical protein
MFDIVIVDDVVDVDLAVIAECKFCTILFLHSRKRELAEIRSCI